MHMYRDILIQINMNYLIGSIRICEKTSFKIIMKNCKFVSIFLWDIHMHEYMDTYRYIQIHVHMHVCMYDN